MENLALVAVTRALESRPKRLRMSPLGMAMNQAQTVLDILAAVSEYFGVTVRDIRGPDRIDQIALARHTAAWMMRQTGMSYPAIKNAIHWNDHTTAMAAVKRINLMILRDPDARKPLIAIVALWRNRWSNR